MNLEGPGAVPLWAGIVGLCMADPSGAGVWGTDPVVGLAGDYASNPVLATGPHTAETDAALLLDAPTTYSADAFKFSLLPSFRLSNAKGYASVISDYDHLSAKGEYDTERSSLSATVGVARDSNLFYDYLSDGNIGVRRDSALADVVFDRFMTERVEFNVDADATRVRFDDSAAVTTLVDYKYVSVQPALTWNTSEKNKYSLIASVGRYNSLNGATESRSGNLQLGLVRQLGEQWTLTATGGYSRALNRIEADEAFIIGFTSSGQPVFVFLPVSVESSQNGSVYSVNLVHQGERLLLTSTASRQVQPTGFAFLSRQQTYELKATYYLTPRLSVSADVRQINYLNPVGNGQFYAVKVPYESLSASWQWTEHWALSIAASHVRESAPQSLFDEQSQEVSLTLSRQFGHVSYQ